MAQERAEPRRQKVFTAAADSKGERGTGLRRGEGRPPALSRSQLAAVWRARAHPYPARHARTHVHTRARPCLRRARVPGAVRELLQPSGPARRSQPDAGHVPARARGHACSYVLRLLTLSALINTSGEAGGR